MTMAVNGSGMPDFEAALTEALPRGIAGARGRIVEAEWLDPAALAAPRWRYRNEYGEVGGILLGYRLGRGVGSMDDRHILTIAGSRGGKGVSLIVPNLLMYDGSVLAIDPKGELARITARARRQKGQKVVVLDPFGVSGQTCGRFNPLEELDPAGPYVKDDAGQVADALIIGNDKDPHWTDSARILVKALILFTLTLPRSERTLSTVWRLLTATHPLVQDLAKRGEIGARAALFLALRSCDAFGGTVASAGVNFGQMAEKELASVFSTALTQLEFLDSDAMASVLSGSDVKLSDLKRERATLYLCLPAMRMGTHARWLRVVINLALVAFERTKAETKMPALMVLDEFAVLGHMKSVETAAGLMAGFGVKLWIVLQDIKQIEGLYQKTWETFMGNSGILTCWANADMATLKYVSDRLGQTGVTLDRHSDITMSQRLSGATGTRDELRVQKLAAPDELEAILERETRRILVKVAGLPPVILQRIRYYEDAPFRGLFDA